MEILEKENNETGWIIIARIVISKHKEIIKLQNEYSSLQDIEIERLTRIGNKIV